MTIHHKDRMTLEQIEALRLGDEVYIWYAKDGNLSDIRSDEVHAVIEASDEGFLTSPSPGAVWDWNWRDWDDPCRAFETGRGPAYFRKIMEG